MTTKALIADLKPHPRNADLYFPSSGPDWDAFLLSIAERGVLEPLTVTSTNTIISGHRRWRAVKELGGTTVPVTIRDFPSYDDELVALVEYNRQRKKTLTETMREAMLVEEITSRKAKERQGARTDIVENFPQSEDLGQKTRDMVAATVGVSGRQYDKMKLIHETAKDNTKVATLVDKLDQGETSVEAIYKYIRASERDPGEFQSKVYNYWFFGTPDTRYGDTHPGQLHPGIIENLLWYFTEEDNLVVDPFAGGGITIDVCKAWNRRCLAYDIDPRRPDIQHNDIRTGYPDDCSNVDLTILDPPYWNMVAEDYSADGASSYSFPEFVDFLKTTAVHTERVTKPGGRVAYIIMPQFYRLPDGVPYIDWPFIWYKMFCETGMVPVHRIYNMWPTSIYQPFHLTQARERGKMLPLMGDLCVFQKRSGDE
jgi:ParB/RepB/Spo0J family partition protein